MVFIGKSGISMVHFPACAMFDEPGGQPCLMGLGDDLQSDPGQGRWRLMHRNPLQENGEEVYGEVVAIVTLW